MLLLLKTLKRREALRKRFACSKETEEQRSERMEKDAFSHREKYVMNSERKCQRARDQYKKALETKHQRVRDQYVIDSETKHPKMRDAYKKG